MNIFKLLAIATLCAACGGAGIIPAKSGTAVLICGEGATLNHTTPAQMRADLEDLLQRASKCPGE